MSFFRKSKFSDSPSKRTVVFLALAMLLAFFGYHKWNARKVVDQDTRSYYAYLPAAFIYKDISMNYTRQNDPFWEDKQGGHRIKLPNGRLGRIQKYTMGMSMLYAPFFALGHITALIGPAPADGYSGPYMFWLQFGGVFYFVLGLIFLRKLLLRHFDERITVWTLVTVSLGTNLFYYAWDEALMPHVYMFALISCLLWATARFFDKPGMRMALLIGLLGGLIVLSRPNHLFIWLIPLFYCVGNFGQMKKRLQFFLRSWKYPLIWLLLSFVIVFPQMLYWHYMSGEWIRYSYTGESFFLTQPKFLQSWFSFRKGWLLWTPMMALALAGMFMLRRRAAEWKLAIPVFFVPAAWLVASWWCWWWGGSYGNRPMIDLYGMLAIPLAATFAWIMEKGKVLKKIGTGLLIFLIVLSLFQTYQYHRYVIHYDSMTMRAYFAIFGRMHHPENWESYLDHPDYEAARLGKE